MELKTKKIYGIRNKSGNIGTLNLLETEEQIKNWQNTLIKMKSELKEDKEHFEEKLNAYKEITDKIEEKDKKEINEKIEQNEKLLTLIRAKLSEINELEIVTIKEDKDEHTIIKVCEIKDFIKNWEEK